MPDLQGVTSLEQMLMEAMGQGQSAPNDNPLSPAPLGQPMAPAMPPPPSPFDQYEQSVLDKLQSDSPEARMKAKVKQYYEDLGIKNPNSFKGQLLARLYEGTRGIKANANRPPGSTNLYNDSVDMTDRLSAEAQKEYEKENPFLKTQAQEIFRTRREREKSAEDFAKAQVGAREKQRATETNERIQQGTQKINMLKAMAQQNVQGAQAALAQERRAGLAQTREALKSDPKYAMYSPQLRDALALQQYNAQYGDDATADLMTTMSDEANMKAPPSVQKDISTNDNTTWGRSIQRLREANEANKLSKWQPNPASGVQIVQTTTTDENGNQKPAFGMFDKRNPGAGVQPVGGEAPKDVDQIKISRAFESGGKQAQAALATMINSTQNGKETDFTGPGEGNTVMRTLRAWGYNGNKTPAEALKDILTSNASLLHTKGMMGGSRFAYQAIEQMNKTLAANPTSSAKSLMYGMAALNYSIELGKMQNAGMLKDEDVSNTLMAKVDTEINRVINSAYADQVFNKTGGNSHRTLTLRPLRDLLGRGQAATTNGTPEKPLTGDAARRALGIPVR